MWGRSVSDAQQAVAAVGVSLEGRHVRKPHQPVGRVWRIDMSQSGSPTNINGLMSRKAGRPILVRLGSMIVNVVCPVIVKMAFPWMEAA